MVAHMHGVCVCGWCMVGVSEDEKKSLEKEGFGPEGDDDTGDEDEHGASSPASSTKSSGADVNKTASATPADGNPKKEDAPSTKSQGGWGSLLMDKVDSKCTEHIHDTIGKHLGPDYTLSGKVRKMQMRLRVCHAGSCFSYR